jgi:hypothetical protein
MESGIQSLRINIAAYGSRSSGTQVPYVLAPLAGDFGGSPPWGYVIVAVKMVVLGWVFLVGRVCWVDCWGCVSRGICH